jgi:hypothetical protein
VKCPSKKYEKRKKVCEHEECGFREEWRGEFRDSKSRQSGFKCCCSCSISHYGEE